MGTYAIVGALEIKEAARRGRDPSHFTAFNNTSTRPNSDNESSRFVAGRITCGTDNNESASRKYGPHAFLYKDNPTLICLPSWNR